MAEITILHPLSQYQVDRRRAALHYEFNAYSLDVRCQFFLNYPWTIISVSNKTKMLPEWIILRKGKVALGEIYILGIYSTFLLCRVNGRNISPVTLERLRLRSHQGQISTKGYPRWANSFKLTFIT